MKRIVCSIISILIYAWFAGVSSASVLLVEKGKTKSIIVIADKPSGTAKKAAGILQEYIEKISGARLDIKSEKDAGSQTRILVGQSETVKKLGINVPSGFTYQMNEEGFVIKTIGNSLVLAGNEDWRYRGTEYAVYDFLEELGCRWFFPGPYGEVIPSVDTIEVDNLDIEEHPSFRFRNIWYAGWMPVTSEDGKNMSRWYGFNKLGALPSRCLQMAQLSCWLLQRNILKLIRIFMLWTKVATASRICCVSQSPMRSGLE